MFNKKYFYVGVGLFVVFILFTWSIQVFDVRAIGPENSTIGFATLNAAFFKFFGVNLFWYHVTDLFGIAALCSAVSFFIVGLWQLLKRKSLKKVDKDIIALGILYAVLIAFYVFFESYIVNYRPILMEGQLEAAYPSSHTLLVIVIMTSVIIQARLHIQQKTLQRSVIILASLILWVTVIGRLLSGVHWLTDIVGATLLSGALCSLYYAYVKQ